jgi:cobalt-zinc-cadmium efflux system membrane fusion protein
LLAAVAVAAPGCRRTAPAAAPATTAAAARTDARASTAPAAVHVSPEVLRDAHVTTTASVRRPLAPTLDLNGQIVPDPDHIALIGARVEARVTRVLVREGDAVARGQPVAVLTSAELARRRAELAATSVRATTARRNAERQRALVQGRLGAEQEAAAAHAEAAAAEAERDALAQIIRGMGAAPTGGGDPAVITLTSPIAGQVVARDAVLGQLVAPDHTLVTVADLSRAFFEAQLFEKDLAQVREQATAEIHLNGYPGKTWLARVLRVSSQIDPKTRTLSARLALETPDRSGLRLGLFGVARVSLPAADAAPRVVVPAAAVADLDGQSVVFVKSGAPGEFQVRKVTVAARAGAFAAIAAGLDADEEVAATGVHTLKSAALKPAGAGGQEEDDEDEP